MKIEWANKKSPFILGESILLCNFSHISPVMLDNYSLIQKG